MPNIMWNKIICDCGGEAEKIYKSQTEAREAAIIKAFEVLKEVSDE